MYEFNDKPKIYQTKGNYTFTPKPAEPPPPPKPSIVIFFLYFISWNLNNWKNRLHRKLTVTTYQRNKIAGNKKKKK